MDIDDIEDFYDNFWKIARDVRSDNDEEMTVADSYKIAAQLHHTHVMSQRLNELANHIDALNHRLHELRTTISYKS